MKKLTPYILIVVVVIVGYFVNAEILEQYRNNDSEQNSGIGGEKSENDKIDDNLKTILVYPKKRQLSDFKLWDTNKIEFSNLNFKNKWNLIFTGYTNCPDICPNTLNDLTHLYEGLSVKAQNQFQFIFFSVDPDRDTPEHMKAYLDNFHSDFIGISGEIKQIDDVIHQLGGVYKLNKSEGEYYSVDHSGRIFIVNPKAQRFGILKSDILQSKDKSLLIKELENLL